ncbi:MAG: histidine phosphotransferase [Micavibrio sp.]|nr:MAG: histidine phosphotransferase [Micavibrio sp.]
MSDIHILELLSSKICHDLISPIGAVNNGVELLEEMDAESSEEVAGLIAFSAQQASGKLQAYRMAYGAGGADSSIKPEDVYNIFEALIGGDGKIKQDWDPHAPIGPEMLPTGFGKILMSCMLLAIDCLPKGGTITVTAEESDQTVIKATGEDASFRENILTALSLDIASEKLEPKIIHPFITGLMAKSYGFKISTQEENGTFVALTLTSPHNL